MKTALVPTDFSENAENALHYAILLAHEMSLKLVFTHVFSLPFIAPEAGMAYDATMIDELQSQYDKNLRNHVDEVYHKLNLNRNLINTEIEVVESLSLSGGLTKLQKKYHADMVLMGTQGAGGIQKFFLGSNAADVAENSSIPVLIIPTGVSYKAIKRIIYASDLQQLSHEIVKVAAYAKIFAAEIDVLHVAEVDSGDLPLSETHILHELRHAADYTSINLHVMRKMSDERLEESIANFCQAIHADMLVIFHHQHKFLQRLFNRSTAMQFVYKWNTPLLIVNDSYV